MSDDALDLKTHDEQMSALFSRREKLGESRFTAINERLTKAHEIPDKAAHRDLLKTIASLHVELPSTPNVDIENWTITNDLTSWQDAKKKLAEVVEGCEKITRVMNTHDPVVFAALGLALDSLPHRELSDLHKAILELRDVAREASAIRGGRGNRPHPDWQVEAARRCMSFWQKHRDTKATGYFRPSKKPGRGKASQGTSPSNDFSRWFCDLMSNVARATVSECETLLRTAKKSPDAQPAIPSDAPNRGGATRKGPVRASREKRPRPR